MKYLFLATLFSLITSFSFSQNRDLRVYLDSKQFFAPGQGNYVEFYLQFVGPSINYIGKNEDLIGELAIQMTIRQGEKLIASDAYRLVTPLMKDSIIADFYDVKRFILEPGEYIFTIQLEDLNGENKALKTSQPIYIDDLSNAISISDIQIAEIASPGDGSSPFYKSGYNIIPRLATFYPKELTTIPVYFEIYNSTELEDSVFAIKQTVINALTNEIVDNMTKYTKLSVSEVVPYLKSVDIADLITGKYILKYTVINKNMKELSVQSYEFDRSNDINYEYFTDELLLNPNFQASITNDSIGYYLESLIPISESNEVRNILSLTRARKADESRKYIQLYWLKTAPQKTYEAWIQYKLQVQSVEKYFGNTFLNGFETDRGRIYLKYGAPTRINKKESSSSEYPYEMWEYNRIGAFNNKKFIFYNPDMTKNSYVLLHSDMIGEIKNPNWPQKLTRTVSTSRDSFGGNSHDMFNE